MMLSSSPRNASLLVETTPETYENNIDSDPYAYPYFKPKSCPLYELIVKGFENESDEQKFETKEIQYRQCTKLYKRIKSRCLIRPAETQWVDSCGETALHRLCQIARFHTSSLSSLLSDEEEHSFEYLDEEDDDEKFASHLRLGQISHNELILRSIKAILDADSTCAANLNNWGETPLHQFLSHCGISSHDTQSSSSSSSFSLKVVELLLQAHPNATSTPNYLRSLPLHDACALSQLGIKEVTSATTQPNIDLTSPPSTKNASSPLPWQEQHSQVINLLIQHQPKALFVKNNSNELPLSRAASSSVSSVSIVHSLLLSMEEYFRTRLIPHYYPMTATTTQRGGKEEEGEGLEFMVKEGMRQSVMGRKKKQLKGGVQKRRVVDAISPLAVNWKQMREMMCRVTFASESSSSPRTSLAHLEMKGRSISTATNSTGIHTSVMTISSMIQSFLWMPFHENSSSLEELQPRALQLSTQLGEIWCKSLLLLHVAYHGTASFPHPPSSSSSSLQKYANMPFPKGETNNHSSKILPSILMTRENKLLHAAIALRAPICIIILASFLNTSGLIVQDESNGGKTPLYLAVEQGGHKRQQEEQLKRHQSKEREETIQRTSDTSQEKVDTEEENDNGLNYESSSIHLLVQISPASAGIPDHKGRLPLHVAIESGYKVGMWHRRRSCQSLRSNHDCSNEKYSTNITVEEDEDKVLRGIFDAEPRAVSIRDPVTRLYPFMMAAAAVPATSLCNENDTSKQDENETCKIVETVFELLRADPSVLRNAPYSQRTERGEECVNEY